MLFQRFPRFCNQPLVAADINLHLSRGLRQEVMAKI